MRAKLKPQLNRSFDAKVLLDDLRTTDEYR
jgi:hypothetical protein